MLVKYKDKLHEIAFLTLPVASVAVANNPVDIGSL